MTTTITVTNGIGSQAGRVGAYDRAAAFSITGLAAEFYNAAVTGEFTTADGATALASQATGTVSATGTVTLTFDTDTANMATLMDGRQQDADARLTVYATTGESNACIAAIKVSPAADHGTTVASSEDTPATLVQVAQEVAAHDADAEAHADLFAATVSWPTADGSALADADRFAVGQLSGEAWTWVAKTGTQLWAWAKAKADVLYATTAQGALAATALQPNLTGALGNLGATPSNTLADAYTYTATVSAEITTWAGITLASGAGCIIKLSNGSAYAIATTGLTAIESGALDDIASDGAVLVLANIGGTVYGRASVPA